MVQAIPKILQAANTRAESIQLAAEHPTKSGISLILIAAASSFTVATTPPNQGILDKKSKCEEMMRMAEGTLGDDQNAISSHLQLNQVPSTTKGET